MSADALRIATWNIHSGIGRDRRYAPERIAEVIEELDADVVALQEVGSRESNGDLLSALGHRTGYTALAGPTHRRGVGDFGNALLTRLPVVESTTIDLAVAGCEPRGALDVVVRTGGPPLRVLATHLGLRPGERRQQVRLLLRALEHDRPLTTVLMGDLNEWLLWGRPLRWLHRHFTATPAPPTFPAGRPVFALDRIWVEPYASLLGLAVHATPLARIASDHLPLVARIRSVAVPPSVPG